MDNRVSMCEWEVGQLVVLLVYHIIRVLYLPLVSQSLIGLNEIKLFLAFIITNLLLIEDHLLSEVLKELIV